MRLPRQCVPHIINHSLPHHRLVPLHQQPVLSLIISLSTHIIGQSPIIYSQSFPTSLVGPLTSTVCLHTSTVGLPTLMVYPSRINGQSFPTLSFSPPISIVNRSPHEHSVLPHIIRWSPQINGKSFPTTLVGTPTSMVSSTPH